MAKLAIHGPWRRAAEISGRSACLPIFRARVCARASLERERAVFCTRNCTEHGWSNLMPNFREVCVYLDNSSKPEKNSSLLTLKQVYTAGYATSLIALVTAVIIFTAFRKFHCTRNYIHINLFISFILRATSVFIKDMVLFSMKDTNSCSSTVTCKGAVAFFHFCILANILWLLVEGLYLQTLLSLTFVAHAKYFWCYCLTGWGTPIVVLTAWIFLRLFIDNEGCWEDNRNLYIWWVIKGAILLAIFVNFLIFLNIIRILVQKLGSSDVGGNSHGHFSRLTKSTLLLIPLLGVHYIVCVFLPDHVAEDLRLYIELGLGSFQGFVVALLYCFLTTEVLTELKRQLRSCCPEGFPTITKRRDRSTSAEISNSCSTQVALLEKLSQRGKSFEYNGSFQTT
ncbi:pituitary adenylate cyclase-activating polypeptide type I receptor-like [Pristis pectinata]|uniref:pituitary adenylate cyclase-activating polypeptide type I receptor-like n=1 Tax=Pristis pectinata TaxID=685728 RepID=UPI00223D8158|nr:pituitary adenylate cyclase-activating polypeptide type I receptor-like [Pristis pectinata]